MAVKKVIEGEAAMAINIVTSQEKLNRNIRIEQLK